jgi:hypothetical protein
MNSASASFDTSTKIFAEITLSSVGLMCKSATVICASEIAASRPPAVVAANEGAIYCHARLGGTLNFYYRQAA